MGKGNFSCVSFNEVEDCFNAFDVPENRRTGYVESETNKKRLVYGERPATPENLRQIDKDLPRTWWYNRPTKDKAVRPVTPQLMAKMKAILNNLKVG